MLSSKTYRQATTTSYFVATLLLASHIPFPLASLSLMPMPRGAIRVRLLPRQWLLVARPMLSHNLHRLLGPALRTVSHNRDGPVSGIRSQRLVWLWELSWLGALWRCTNFIWMLSFFLRFQKGSWLTMDGHLIWTYLSSYAVLAALSSRVL